MRASSWRDAVVGAASRVAGLAFRGGGGAVVGHPEQILVLKPCCLGDVLLATATVAQARRAFPQARIDFAVGPWARPALENNPDIDGLLRFPHPLRPASYLALARGLRHQRYDLCLVLDRSPLLALLPWLAGIPVRAGLDSDGRGFALTHKVAVEPTRHEAELYLNVARAVGIAVENPRPRYHPKEADLRWAEALLSSPKPGGAAVVVHPGGGENPGMSLPAKRWPVERYAAVVERLLAASARVFLVGSGSDRGVSRALLDRLPVRVRDKAIADNLLADFTGSLSFSRLGALLSRSNLFLGNDSAPLHLAAAVGTPVVAVFGPSDPRVYGPYGVAGSVLYKGLECSPCLQKGRWNSACPRYRCVEAIEVEEVWRALAQGLRPRPISLELGAPCG